MHLTGDREASILHEKVGRLLDKEFGRAATRDEIREWLERCTIRLVYTEDTRQVKAALIHELNPELNEVVPLAHQSASARSRLPRSSAVQANVLVNTILGKKGQ